MNTLAEFLLARIDEDEDVAQAAGPTSPTRWQIHTTLASIANGERVGPRGTVEFAPARVLAECEAKRRIVELHRIDGQSASVWHDRPDGLRELVKATEYSCAICGWVMEDGPEPTGVAGCDTIRALALPYAGHSDYREEWRP